MLRIERALRRRAVELALEPVRRLFAPDALHVVQRLLGLAIAVRAQVADGLGVAGDAGAHAQHKPAANQVVDHRDLRRRHRRVVVGEGQHAGAESYRRAGVSQACDEGEARSDRFGRVDEMLADEGLAIAEPVGEHDRLAVLAQDVAIGRDGGWTGWMKKPSSVSLACGSPCTPVLPAEAHKQRAPAGAAGRGLASELCQALVGAVLLDYYDYYDVCRTVLLVTQRTLSRAISAHNQFGRSAMATLAADQLRAEVVTASVRRIRRGVGRHGDVRNRRVTAPVDLQTDVVRSATGAGQADRRDEGRAAALVVGTTPGQGRVGAADVRGA